MGKTSLVLDMVDVQEHEMEQISLRIAYSLCCASNEVLTLYTYQHKLKN